MSPTRLPRWARRLIPQRVRTRLTLLYAALFLAAGSVLLALTYGLVANSINSPPLAAQPHLSRDATAQILQLCKQATQSKQTSPKQANSRPAKVPDKVLALCNNAYAAGAKTAAESQRNQTLHHLLLFSLIGLAVMTVASAALGWIMSGRVLRPIRRITETAKRASDAHLGERLALAGPRDELRTLGDTFDDMLERLDAAFSAQRRFVANASHELRTPLTIMRTAVDVTLSKPTHTDDQIDAMAKKVRRSIERAEATIDALLTLATSDQGSVTRESVDLATAAEDALDNQAAAIAARHLHIAAVLEPAETAGDTELLDRMVANLVDNAIHHNIDNGWIHIRTHATDDYVLLEISNSGPVITSDTVPTLFEPFRRAAERTGNHNGVGLGLSIVQSIATAHDATIQAHSQPNGGFNISVQLPKSNGSDAAPADIPSLR